MTAEVLTRLGNWFTSQLDIGAFPNSAQCHSQGLLFILPLGRARYKLSMPAWRTNCIVEILKMSAAPCGRSLVPCSGSKSAMILPLGCRPSFWHISVQAWQTVTKPTAVSWCACLLRTCNWRRWNAQVWTSDSGYRRATDSAKNRYLGRPTLSRFMYRSSDATGQSSEVLHQTVKYALPLFLCRLKAAERQPMHRFFRVHNCTTSSKIARTDSKTKWKIVVLGEANAGIFCSPW